MTLKKNKKNRIPLLCYFNLIASSHSHQWIKTQLRVKFFFVPCDLEIWWMTLKTLGHHFYATSSFVYHFIAIGEFKQDLQPGNVQFGWKSAFLVACHLEILRMTLKNNRVHIFDALCIIPLPLLNSNWSYSSETPNSGQNGRFFVRRDIEI